MARRRATVRQVAGWVFVVSNLVLGLYCLRRVFTQSDTKTVVLDSLGKTAVGLDGGARGVLEPSKVGEKVRNLRDKVDGWAGRFKILDKNLIDPNYNFNGECKWYSTLDCTPYGRIEGPTKSCQDAIPATSSGICQCRDGRLYGKPCESVDSAVLCAQVCSVKTAEVYPKYQDLMKYSGTMRVSGVIVSFSGRKRYAKLCRTLSSVRTNFNADRKYPLVVVHEPHDDFPEAYRRGIATHHGSAVHFLNADPKLFAVPGWVNQSRILLEKHSSVPNMDSLLYRQAARYMAGIVFNEPVLEDYNYALLLDDVALLLCELPYDPFVLMKAENKTVGFTMMYHDFAHVMPSIDDRIAEAFNPTAPLDSYHLQYLLQGGYSGCIFSPGFLFLDLGFLRSPSFTTTFSYLDRSGGFFYERWSRPAAHTLLATSLLPSTSLYYFESVAVANLDAYHVPNDPFVCRQQPVPPRDSPGANDWRHPCLQNFAPLAELSKPHYGG